MKKVVVLGGSFGGLTAALELRRMLGKGVEISVVSDDSRFVFLPSLPWLIMGWRKPEDITLKAGEILKPKVPIIYLTSEPYVGHMGVGGVGNSKRFLEDEFANREIKFLTNQVVEEVIPDEVRLKDGSKLPFKLAMIAPPFKGIPAVAPIGNPRGFIPVDKNYRHTKYKNIFAIGVAMAIAPPELTPVPTGVPKTGHMTVKMAKTAAATIAAELRNEAPPSHEELSVICLMDMGNTAAYMKAKPILPPRQELVLMKGIWFKSLKAGFERYFLWKMKHGLSNLP